MSAAVLALAYVVGTPASTQAASVAPPVDEFASDFAATGSGAFSDPAIQAMLTGASSVLTLGFLRSKARAFDQLGLAAHTKGARCAAPGIDQHPAVAALDRASAAPTHVSYTASRVVQSSTGSQVDTFTVQVRHVSGVGTSYETDVPGRAPARAFVPAYRQPSGLEGKPVAALLDSYDLSVERSQILDDRNVTVIDACQHDHLVARFWVDNASGMLLSKALYLGDNLVRWSGLDNFTQLVSRQSQQQAMQQPSKTVQVQPASTLSASQAAALNDEGWICPARVATDFDLALLGQVQTSRDTMHVEYTDGLSTLSIYEQRGQLDPARLHGFDEDLMEGQPVYLRVGLPTVAVWQSGDTVFTLVTDAPQQELPGLLGALPHQPGTDGGGVTGRIGSGLDKLASAVAP